MKSHYLFATLLGLAVCFTSCNESAIYPGDNAFNQDSIYVAPPMPDPTDSATVAALASVPDSLLLTAPEARAICATLASGQATKDYYYIKGWICGLHKDNESGITGHGNATFYLGVSKFTETKHAFLPYQVNGLNGKAVKRTDAVQVGDFVIVKGHLTNYNGTYETVSKGDGHIYYSTNPNIAKRPEAIDVTCAEAKQIALALSANNTPTTEYYCVTGYITNVVGTPSKGQQTFWMNDSTGTVRTFEGYYTNLPDGVTTFTVGQHVKLYGHIMKYNTTPEIKNGEVEFIVDEK